MEQLDLQFIGTEEAKKEKRNKLHENKSLLGQFLLLQNNLFKFIKNFSCYEFCLWLKYKTLYIDRKSTFSTQKYKKGDLIYVELGANIANELSYIHPCVVLENKQQDLFVIPCSSSKLSKAYDKNGNLFPEYLVGEPSDGFYRKTVLILNNVKWISKTRVVKNMGTINAPFLKKIFEETFTFNYPMQSFILNKLDKKNKENEEKIKELTKIIEEKDKIINQQISEIENLKLTNKESI